MRCLRPDYQRPLAGEPIAENLPIPGLEVLPTVEPIVASAAKWSASLSDRIAAIRGALDAGSDALDAEQVSRRFKGASRTDFAEILDSV